MAGNRSAQSMQTKNKKQNAKEQRRTLFHCFTVSLFQLFPFFLLTSLHLLARKPARVADLMTAQPGQRPTDRPPTDQPTDRCIKQQSPAGQPVRRPPPCHPRSSAHIRNATQRKTTQRNATQRRAEQRCADDETLTERHADHQFSLFPLSEGRSAKLTP